MNILMIVQGKTAHTFGVLGDSENGKKKRRLSIIFISNTRVHRSTLGWPEVKME